LNLKVLQINKFFFLKGGAERYFFQLSELLGSKGHEVIPFAMQDRRNLPSPFADRFVSHVALNGSGTTPGRIKTAFRVLYSLEARQKLGALVRQENPNVAHLHNIAHQLSPSIIGVLKRAGIPMVQTLHDYKLACPAYLMIARGEPCEACVPGKFYNVLVNKCTQDSLTASAVSCLEMYLHRLMKTYSNVDAFLCPSRFIMDIMKRAGFSEDKLFHVPNFLDTGTYEPSFKRSGYCIYVGRLSREKGLDVLLDARRRVKHPDLVVVGDGELREELERRASNGNGVSFSGFLSKERLAKVWRGAAFTVVPSVWYENFPYAILESFAFGKPVIASRIGGMPELVKDGETGLLVEPGNSEELAEKISYLISKPEEVWRMGQMARRTLEEQYSVEKHYESIMSLYERMLR
jgi:glycosyltransferase involved in cell wall biosynthesis